MILFTLEENEIHDYVKKNVSEPEDDEGKSRHKKNEAKAKRILRDSLKDIWFHMLPRRILQNRCMMPWQDCLRARTLAGN